MKLANAKIGKKMGLLVGASALLVVCLTAVAVFGLHAVHTAMAESGAERHVMMLSQTVAANVGGIAQRVATMVMSKHGGQELHAELLALRKEYMAAFGELKSSEATAEGKRLLGQADQVAARWRDADNRALALLSAGKRAEAAELHDAEIVPRFHELSVAIFNYREYSGQIVARINDRVEALMSRTTFILIAFGLTFLVGSLVFGM